MKLMPSGILHAATEFVTPIFATADIVEIKHIMLPPSPREFKDIYVVFELMETDLHQVRPQNGTQCVVRIVLIHFDCKQLS